MDREAEQRYLDECVRLVPEAYVEECTRLSADMAYWGQRYADALLAHLNAETDRKKVWAQRFGDLAAELEITSKSGKPPSIAAIEAAVERDVAYLAVCSRENRAEAEKVRLHEALKAIQAKADMLMQIGAHQRAEMGAGKYGERE